MVERFRVPKKGFRDPKGASDPRLRATSLRGHITTAVLGVVITKGHINIHNLKKGHAVWNIN